METVPVDSVTSYNLVRFNAYRRCATEFVHGELYDMHELANMLHDVRWAEVPRAFSVALYNAACKGPLRPGLELEFKQLLAYVTFLAFGSTEREVVQPWFLKNWDDFFVSCIDGILSLNNRSDAILRKREVIIRRAFRGTLTLIEGARRYMSLDRLTHSSAVHALLVAAGHARNSFLWNGFVQIGGDASAVPRQFAREAARPMTLAHVFLMDVIAEAILATGDSEVVSWARAFGHYAGAVKWRAYSQRCRVYVVSPGKQMPRAVLLEHQVMEAYRLAYMAAASLSTTAATGGATGGAVVQKKRKRSASSTRVEVEEATRGAAAQGPPPPIVDFEGTAPWPVDSVGSGGGWGLETPAVLRCH